jgi:hypothetical protein
MRTRKARRLRRQAIWRSRVQGHRPAPIATSGALNLYGCLNKNCASTFEVWDNPDHVAGMLIHTTCPDIHVSWLRKLMIKLLPF